MAALGWTPEHLSRRQRAYGVRSRLRRFRWELSTGGLPLLAWFPLRWLVDPLALVDICSPWEVAWVTRHMAKEARGTGAIVELGPWLGDITLGMIHGLHRNRRARGASIDAYDLFVFDDIEERTVGLPFEGALRNGDEFRSLFLHRLGDDASQVRAHPGDIVEQTWDPDRPIEFLFNDISKTWNIWNHVRATFYRALQPGSTLVEQDWAHACTPWIHLWHHRYRSALEPVGQVPNAGSLAFRLTTHLPPAAFESEHFADYSESEVTAAFDWAASLVDPTRQPNVRAAHVHLYTLHGDLDAASRICVRELATSLIDSELVTIALPVLAERLLSAEFTDESP